MSFFFSSPGCYLRNHDINSGRFFYKLSWKALNIRLTRMLVLKLVFWSKYCMLLCFILLFYNLYTLSYPRIGWDDLYIHEAFMGTLREIINILYNLRLQGINTFDMTHKWLVSTKGFFNITELISFYKFSVWRHEYLVTVAFYK